MSAPQHLTVPVNGTEWVERWNELTTEQKVQRAEWIMADRDTASACFQQDHAERIKALEAQLKVTEGWWQQRFEAGMRAVEPDIKWRDDRIAELQVQVADLTKWRDAVLAASQSPVVLGAAPGKSPQAQGPAPSAAAEHDRFNPSP